MAHREQSIRAPTMTAVARWSLRGLEQRLRLCSDGDDSSDGDVGGNSDSGSTAMVMVAVAVAVVVVVVLEVAAARW